MFLSTLSTFKTASYSPPPVSPEGGFHTLIQSKGTTFGKSLFDNIHRTLESGALVLHPNFDELKRSDYNGFGSTGKTTGKDGNRLCVFSLSVVGEESTPRSVSSNCPNISSHRQSNADWRQHTFDCSLGGFEHERRQNAPVQAPGTEIAMLWAS